MVVKESERKKPYHLRGPHKEGCLCGVCKRKRTTQEVSPPFQLTTIPPPPPPVEVRLDSLRVKARFKIGKQEHLIKEHIEGMVVCYNLFTNDTVTLGGATIVEPIK